jgi:hypothetical protein
MSLVRRRFRTHARERGRKRRVRRFIVDARDMARVKEVYK